MPIPREDAGQVLAARRFLRGVARVFVFAYVTGAILLLPGFLPSAAAEPASSQDRIALGARDEVRATILAVPPATVDRTEPAQTRTHKVRLGESLDAIASDFGVSAETVAYNNKLNARSELRAGTTLKIPPVNGAFYVVKEGDTYESVAARFEGTVGALMEVNHLYFEPQNFAAGKEIVVPTARFPDFEFDPAVARAGSSVARGQMPAAVPVPVAGRLMMPVAGNITQGFSAYHSGIDIAAPYGTAIAASDAGWVSAVGWVAVGGLRVCVKHDSGVETCYYHTSAVYVAVGQRVTRGQVIAAIGLTGVTTGPHVHWEANVGGVPVNPLAY